MQCQARAIAPSSCVVMLIEIAVSFQVLADRCALRGVPLQTSDAPLLASASRAADSCQTQVTHRIAQLCQSSALSIMSPHGLMLYAFMSTTAQTRDLYYANERCEEAAREPCCVQSAGAFRLLCSTTRYRPQALLLCRWLKASLRVRARITMYLPPHKPSPTTVRLAAAFKTVPTSSVCTLTSFRIAS